jgi:MFS family permease
VSPTSPASPTTAATGDSTLRRVAEEAPDAGAPSLSDVRLYRGRLGILGACCTVAFARSVDPRLWMMGLDIPPTAFDAGWQDYRVFTTVTGLLLIAGMLVGGLLGDVIGRRRVLLGGALTSTVFGALAMVAPNVPWFAVTRSIDALAGAMAFPLTLAVLRLTFPRRERPLALLLLTVATGGGLLAGLLAILIEPLAGWRATLLLPTVAGAVGTRLVWRHVLESRAQEHLLLRAATAAAWALALLPLTLGASAARLTGTWGNPVTLTGLALAATGVALAGLLWRGRVRDLLPDNLAERKHHFLSVMLVTGATLNFAFTGYALQLYGFFTVVYGFSGVLAGLALEPRDTQNNNMTKNMN